MDDPSGLTLAEDAYAAGAVAEPVDVGELASFTITFRMPAGLNHGQDPDELVTTALDYGAIVEVTVA